MIVAYRNGAPVRVRDIGEAVDGPPDATQRGLEQRQARRVPRRLQAARRQRHQDGREHQADAGQARSRDPADIHVNVLSDRTTTIRASVNDVQFTLMLTIGLVVMVIFVFLRSFWATVIPSITVPLALLGAAALMWAASYSLDNLSLMAFTIAVGFVVDDAIVMLENIARHIEEGMKPFEAALKGAGEIGFTIVSISISLVAVLIPLLLMSGIIGRLFREFAVTIAMTIFVSAFVSLTLTPMMASRFLKSHDEERHGRLFNMQRSGCSTGLRAATRAGSTSCCAISSLTLLVVPRHRRARPVYLFVVIPKGFFPQQDTGIIVRHVGSRPGRVVPRDGAAAGAGSARSSGRPRRRHDGDGARHRRRQRRAEQRAHVHHAEAARRARRRRVPGDRAAAAQARRRSRACGVYLQAAQDVTVGARFARTQFQYTIQDANLDELNAWSPKILDKLKSLPELRDVATDQQVAGTTLQLKIDRDMASRFGIQPQLIDDTLYDAFGQRQVTQYFTQVNTYEVIEEITPALQADPATLEQDLHPRPVNRADGAA